MQIPSTFGIQKSNISRKFIRASAKRLKAFQDRDLSSHEILVIFMDGKNFAENKMIIALGVTLSGQKIDLGAIESSTENVVAYLPKGEQNRFRKKLQKAYEQKEYGQAKQKLSEIRKALQLINESAVVSLDEGLEDTLTLHRLGLFEQLGLSLKTTNCIESLNSQLEQYTRRVSYWKNSNQRQRWVATALLEIEPSLRKVKGFKFLPMLKNNMNNFDQNKNQRKAA